MKSRLASEINRILILSGIAALAGVSLDSLWPVVIALAGYIVWHVRQLFELYSWLTQKEHTEPRTAPACGAIFTPTSNICSARNVAPRKNWPALSSAHNPP